MVGFGRIPAPDPRDYPMRAVGVRRSLPTRPKYWNGTAWQGDQGDTSQCVAYSFMTWWHDGPVTHKAPRPTVDPAVLYHEAQLVDEWEGESPAYEGTSVRAGAKAMQARGLIESYYWTRDINEVANAIATKGPVVVGTDWLEGMMDVNSVGLIRATGNVLGGHAYVLNGVDPGRRRLRIHNSWGIWGKPRGHAYIGFDDMQRLLADQGDAVLAIERR